MDETLRAGVERFNQERYFEAHEAFEDLWRAATGDRRQLYQGLVQVCAGLVKHQRNEPAPAVTLLRRGLDRIAGVPPAAWPVALCHDDLLPQLRGVAEALRSGGAFTPPVMRPSRVV